MQVEHDIPLDHITEAHFVRPSQLHLRFADGLEGTWTFDQLALDMSNMKSSTVKASPSGHCVELKSKWGEDVQLDAASFRYLVDKKYAAKIDKSIKDLHFSPAEADEASRLSQLTRDPRWSDVGDEDDLFE